MDTVNQKRNIILIENDLNLVKVAIKQIGIEISTDVIFSTLTINFNSGTINANTAVGFLSIGVNSEEGIGRIIGTKFDNGYQRPGLCQATW